MAKKRTPQNGKPSNGRAVVEEQIEYVSITEETRRRYLNYAMSVITARALPDVRDGLKPVQRRILYVMHHDLSLNFEGTTRKCAKICGDTTGNYHPHGDQAVYEALARMTQDFSLRMPLIVGQGNFGSIMGLKAAAARYTEAKLARISEQLVTELRSDTVDMRPNYDGTKDEPSVFPARYPNLLVNGTQGIAVGMATSIPPHNLREVIKACVLLIHNPEATVAQVMKYVKGPDFPLGGRIVTDRADLRKAYEQGRGAIRVRGVWDFDQEGRKTIKNRIVIQSIPYEVRTGPLAAAIGDIIAGRKVPGLVDVADETDQTRGLRIVLDLKSGADPNLVMSYLYKNTDLEKNFNLDMTCLVPGDEDAMVPARLSLVEVLKEFLDFRFKTVKRRFEYQLRQLEARLHILEGFAIIFDGLERALQLIRESEGKRDAAEKLMAEFPLDETQTYAVLELQLYRISSLEIGRIVEELETKRKEAERIRKILASDKRLWGEVESELEAIAEEFGERRRTGVGSSEEVEEFDPLAYVVRENTNVVLTREGWMKRVGKISKIESIRVREGDEVFQIVPTATTEFLIVFASDGAAYTLPVNQIPASNGYGDPLSKYVKLGDGARVVAAFTTDSRFTRGEYNVEGEDVPGPHVLIATKLGQVTRFSLAPLREASTKSGRKFCRLVDGDEVVSVEQTWDSETLFLATKQARVIHFRLDEVPVLANPGKGVMGIKLEANDEVLGAVLLDRPSDALRVINTNGNPVSFGQTKYQVTSRGGKGVKTSSRIGFDHIVPRELTVVDWSEFD